MQKDEVCKEDNSKKSYEPNNISDIRDHYIFSTSPEQAHVAKMLVSEIFKNKSLDETLKQIDETLEVLDFIHQTSSQDLTWIVSTLKIFATVFAYKTKPWDEKI